MSELELSEGAPNAQQYRALRRAVGWRDLAPRDAELALGNSLFAVCARRDGEVVGCGRVAGDGGMYQRRGGPFRSTGMYRAVTPVLP